NAMLVPAAGVTHNAQGNATAMVVGNDNKVVVRTVETKSMSGSNWIVTKGLADGERVIVAGVQQAKPGAVVKPVLAAATAPAPAAGGDTRTAAAATPAAQ